MVWSAKFIKILCLLGFNTVPTNPQLQIFPTFPFPNTGMVLGSIVVVHHGSKTHQNGYHSSFTHRLFNSDNSDAFINYIVIWNNTKQVWKAFERFGFRCLASGFMTFKVPGYQIVLNFISAYHWKCQSPCFTPPKYWPCVHAVWMIKCQAPFQIIFVTKKKFRDSH